MEPDHLVLFDTALGACGLAWRDRGVAGVQLPEGSPDATLARMRRRFPGARPGLPAGAVKQAIDDIVALLRGAPVDLASIELDLDGVPDFPRRVYDVARTIPPGATLTYREVAARLGGRGLARAVGQALGRNPFSIIVPCHRVLAASGRLGGFSATGGASTKAKMLAIEGALLALH